MRLFTRLIIAAGVCAASVARAGEPLDLLQGYGRSAGGKPSRKSNNSTAIRSRGWPVTRAATGADPSLFAEVGVIDLKLPGTEPFANDVLFRFLEGRLCAVEVTLAWKIREVTTNGPLAKAVWEKYYADPKVRASLAEHHLLVWLSDTGRKPDAQSPDDLMPSERIVSSVWYENRELWEQQVSKARVQKRQEAEKARQAATAVNLKELL